MTKIQIVPFIFQDDKSGDWYFQDSELQFRGPWRNQRVAMVRMQMESRYALTDAPKINMHMTEEEATCKAVGATSSPTEYPKLIRGAKTIAKRIEVRDFVQGHTKRRCSTCGRRMGLKHFQRHAIEGCRRHGGKKNGKKT